METTEEKRRYVRVKVNYFLWYKVYDSDIDNSDYKLVLLQDLSEGGALFTTEEKLPARVPVYMELKIPNRRERVELFGEVVRSDNLDHNPSLFSTAVKFQDINNNESLKEIANIVNARLI